MGNPGSGRYTAYVGPALLNKRYAMLNTLFNARSPKGDIYENAGVNDNVTAAANVVKYAGKFFTGNVKGNDMFSLGVDLNFGDAPTLADVKAGAIGGPVNSFVPNLSSPGASAGDVTNIVPIASTAIAPIDLNSRYLASPTIQSFATDGGGNTGVGTVSPNSTSDGIGKSSIGSVITIGSYLKK
jgi:hypothetical protein